MVRVNWKYSWIFILLICWQGVNAQGHLFSDVKISQSNVYVGQPLEVTVSVYTSTWFTKGVDPGNVKVNDAFTVYFRSVSITRQINGKTYAGVQMIFNVFPYDDEDIEFPSLDINVETPDDDDYKGKHRVVKTKARKINVKPVPPGYDKNEWLVAYSMTVTDNWKGDKTNVKVGDVLERRINREVSGTVSEFIPPINWDTIPGVSLYPARSEVNNHKSKTAISASRTDAVRYLFEKEGEITIPEKVLTWWNPGRNKLYKRTLKEFTINVLPNPDLGMLESVRDSLKVSLSSQDTATDEKSVLTILGLSVRQIAILLVSILPLIYLIIKGSKFLRININKRQEQYHNSELYYFRQFKKALKKQDTDRVVQALYRWIDQIELEEPTLRYFTENFGNNELTEEIKLFEQQLNSDRNTILALNKKPWTLARKNYLKGRIQPVNSNSDLWMNPMKNNQNLFINI